jgi:SAM-dependent methyltransferase
VLPDYFDERVAERYDSDFAEMFQAGAVSPAVELLAGLAGSGPALEFGIGTGRIALPLRARGVRLQGVDLSPAMVARLRAKVGAEDIEVTIGDFARTKVHGRFRLVYLVFNTIMNLTSQEAQVDCFRNAATHLGPGGSFVIEVNVPRLEHLGPGENFRPFVVTPTQLGFDEYETATQKVTSHHYRVAGGRLEFVAIPFRYVWPSELDLMAQLAGLRLKERWGDWDRAPFTSKSTKHISLWEKPAGPGAG